MRRLYLFLSIVLLATFVGYQALEFCTDPSNSQLTLLLEEADIEDKQDETKEIQLELEGCEPSTFGYSTLSDVSCNSNFYAFAIKSHFANIQSPPPEL